MKSRGEIAKTPFNLAFDTDSVMWEWFTFSESNWRTKRFASLMQGFGNTFKEETFLNGAHTLLPFVFGSVDFSLCFSLRLGEFHFCRCHCRRWSKCRSSDNDVSQEFQGAAIHNTRPSIRHSTSPSCKSLLFGDYQCKLRTQLLLVLGRKVSRGG